MNACLAVTCHLHFWRNDWDLPCATAVTWGWNMDTKRRVSTESWPWRRKLSCCSCRDLNPGPFNHKFDALTTELSLLPMTENSSRYIILWRVNLSSYRNHQVICSAPSLRSGTEIYIYMNRFFIQQLISIHKLVYSFPFLHQNFDHTCRPHPSPPHPRKQSSLQSMRTRREKEDATDVYIYMYKDQEV